MKEPILQYREHDREGRRVSRLAIVALVIAVLSIPTMVGLTKAAEVVLRHGEADCIGFVLFVVSEIAGATTAAVALFTIKRSNGRLIGRRPAIAALVLCSTMCAFACLILSVDDNLRAGMKRIVTKGF